MNTEEDIHVKDTNITNIKDEKLDQTSIEDILHSDPDVPSTGRFDFVVRHWITGETLGCLRFNDNLFYVSFYRSVFSLHSRIFLYFPSQRL